MQLTTLEQLKWIHDCVLVGLAHEISSDGVRLIRLTIECPPDLGYEPWEGKTLLLAAVDVAVSQYFLWSVAGPETIDAIRPGVLTDIRARMTEAKEMGMRFPGLEFLISFHSGSLLEVVCKELQVEVISLVS